MKKVVVTGAQTELGRRVVEMLLERGHAVTALAEDKAELRLPGTVAARAGARLTVGRFDLLVAEDAVPTVHGPCVLVHLAVGRTPAEHLAKARTARLLADALDAERVVALSSPAEVGLARDNVAGARRLAEMILADGTPREVVAVRAGLLESDVKAGAAVPEAGRFRFLRCRGWISVALSDRDPVAQGVVNAVESAAVAGTAVVTTVPVRAYVRAWRLRPAAA